MSLIGQTIFVGPQEIAGFLSRSVTALADEGANVIAFKQVHEKQHPERVQHPKIQWLFADVVESFSEAPSIVRSTGLFFIKLFALFTALQKADACLFIGGKGFFNYPIDYYLLRLFGKRVVHMYVGTASRPRYLSAYAKKALDPDKGIANKFTAKLIKRTRRQQARVRATSRAANCVIENPLCGHFQTRPFVNYFKIGMPIRMNDESSETQTETTTRKTRILHCPSRPEIKGTQRILDTLTPDVFERLNAELIVLTGVPHSRVLKEIQKCDFIIDQLYSDSPLAGFAAEAASHRRVPIVGGYGWEDIRQSLDNEDIPPAMLCTPKDLLITVEELCNDSSKRQQLASDLEKFLTQGAWSGQAFASKLGRVLDNDVPDSWLVDPQSIRYKHGVGLSEHDAKGIIRKMTEFGGTESLHLGDKTELESSIQTWLQPKA
jgi:hypothetical protein